MQIINTSTRPPLGLEWQIRRSLRWIEESHLQGLAYVQIADELPEEEETGDASEWAIQARAEGTHIYFYGWYSPSLVDEPAYIMLYARQIYRGIPRFLWWSTLPTLRIVRALAHEVGHHLAATRGYVIQPGEDRNQEESLADRYAANVLERMTKHWSYKLGQWGIKDLAGWHYVFGIADLRAKKYGSAADCFYKSWVLDRQNEDALNLYWRAREMADAKLR